MKRIHKTYNENKIIEIHVDRQSIKKEMRMRNTIYFKQAHQIIVCKDKTCCKLRIDKVREKVLNGRIRNEDCDDQRMCQFLRLMKVLRTR